MSVTNLLCVGSLSFLLRYLDFEPGDHTLILTVTATDGQSDTVTVTFTTPPRLTVICDIVDSILSCDSTTQISSQTCSFNGMPQMSCVSPYDIRSLNLSPDDHSVTVFIADVFGQTTQFSFDFSTIPTTPITLHFTSRLSLVEGTDTNVSSLFSIASI